MTFHRHSVYKYIYFYSMFHVAAKMAIFPKQITTQQISNSSLTSIKGLLGLFLHQLEWFASGCSDKIKHVAVGQSQTNTMSHLSEVHNEAFKKTNN